MKELYWILTHVWENQMKTRLLIIVGIIAIFVVMITYFGYVYYATPPELQKIYDYCFYNSIGSGVFDIGLSYTNETHYIDNNTCEWQLLENYPNSDNLCIPGQHVENNEHRIRNGTHIYDNESCMWKELEMCTGYCGEK